MSKPDDNLEALSNAELHAKCKEFGLPNVPVADSTRSVIIKKLRLYMSGGDPAAAKKATDSPRRQTMQGTKVSGATEAAAAPPKEQVKKSEARPASRRTIAAPSHIASSGATAKTTPPGVEVPTGIKVPGTLTSHFGAAATTTKTTPPAVEPPTGIPKPIAGRRRSSQNAPAQSAPPRAEIERPLLILESDEEDDEDLVRAARDAEQYSRSWKPRDRNSRSVSLTKTGVVTTSYSADVAVPPPVHEQHELDYEQEKYRRPTLVYNGPREEDSLRHNFTQPPQRHSMAASTFSATKYTSIPPAGVAAATQQEAASFYSPSNVRRTAHSYSSPLYPKLPTDLASSTTYYNEQSDTDGGAEEPLSSPYLSNFTRKLESIKAEPLGRTSGNSFFSRGGGATEARYRRTQGYGYLGTGSLGTRYQQPAQGSWAQQWAVLERKYHLKRNLVLLLVLLLIVFLFVLFWQ